MSDIKQDLRLMYNGLAKTYGRDYKFCGGQYFMWRKINTALSLGAFSEGGKILEIGCANGAYTLELAKLGFNVTGLDLSSECIKQASELAQAENLTNIKFMVGDAEDLSSFPDDTFDGVVSFSCLRYLPDPQRSINEIYRVLKKNKRAVVDFPNKASPWFNGLRPLLTGPKHIHDHAYSTDQVKSFLKVAGFLNIKARRILFTPRSLKNRALLSLFKVVDIIGGLPGFNHFAAIIMCGGEKL